MKKMKSVPVKLLAFLIIAAIISGFYGIDYVIAKTYQIQVVSITPAGDIPADGKSVVVIKVKLARNGRAIRNHKMVAVPKGGGSLKNTKILTDSEGEVTFQYIPYLASDYVKTKPAKIEIYDDSNSVFISVPARISIILNLSDPSGSDSSNTNEGIF